MMKSQNVLEVQKVMRWRLQRMRMTLAKPGLLVLVQGPFYSDRIYQQVLEAMRFSPRGWLMGKLRGPPCPGSVGS